MAACGDRCCTSPSAIKAASQRVSFARARSGATTRLSRSSFSACGRLRCGRRGLHCARSGLDCVDRGCHVSRRARSLRQRRLHTPSPRARAVIGSARPSLTEIATCRRRTCQAPCVSGRWPAAARACATGTRPAPTAAASGCTTIAKHSSVFFFFARADFGGTQRIKELSPFEGLHAFHVKALICFLFFWLSPN